MEYIGRNLEYLFHREDLHCQKEFKRPREFRYSMKSITLSLFRTNLSSGINAIFCARIITRREGRWWWKAYKTGPAIPDVKMVSSRRHRADTPLASTTTLPHENSRGQSRSIPSWWSDTFRESRYSTDDLSLRIPCAPPSYPCNDRWESYRCPADSRFCCWEMFYSADYPLPLDEKFNGSREWELHSLLNIKDHCNPLSFSDHLFPR